jgi:PHD/YefM family antitoxin component YafN of YafNO toxin-antitoxin module
MAKNNVTIRNERGEVVMVINRAEWELSWVDEEEADVREQMKALRVRRRELRTLRAQMRDMHELEAR